MSWDVMVFRFKGTPPKNIEEIDDAEILPLGPADDIRQKISTALAGVDWTDPTWGLYDGDGFSIEFNVGDDDPIESIMLHVRGGGNAIAAIMTFAVPLGWSALDCSTSEFLDSRWDALHYLLSANRRDEQPDNQDIILEHAVLGATHIADHALGAQGAPLKHVGAKEMRSIAKLLESITSSSLRRQYNPMKMECAGVYKFWADRADDVWLDIDGRFNDFRTFYLDAARHGESVIVCLD